MIYRCPKPVTVLRTLHSSCGPALRETPWPRPRIAAPKWLCNPMALRSGLKRNPASGSEKLDKAMAGAGEIRLAILSFLGFTSLG